MGKQDQPVSSRPPTLASIVTWEGVLVARVYERSRSEAVALVAVRAGRACYLEAELPRLLAAGESAANVLRRAGG